MLGSFHVRADDGVLADVPGARLPGLLIALALEPGHAVPKATLVDWIWGERPPSEAANALQRLVSRLRKALPDGAVEGQTDRYRLPTDPDAVAAVRFERLVGQARNGEDPGRVRLLREALALWRGAAMQDVGLQDSGAVDAAGPPARGAAPDGHGGSVRCGGQPRPRCGAGHGTDRLGGRASDARTAGRCADACPRRGRPRQRGTARVPAHARSPGRRAGCRSLTGAVRIARRAAAGRAGAAGAAWAGGGPEDQLARRADQLRRQGR